MSPEFSKLFSALVLLPFAMSATTYYVSSSGDDSNAGTSPDSPYASLSVAIAAANNDVTAEAVVVVNDITTPATVEITGAYTLRGATQQASDTILSVEAKKTATPVLKISNASATVENITISGGTGSSSAPGNLWLNGGGTARNVVLCNATANTYGGGAFNNNGRLIDCVITNNTTTGGIVGGGVYQTGADALIDNCLIAGNKGYGYSANGGGGIYSLGGKIQNSVISNNVSRNRMGHGANGGGVYMKDTTLINSLIAYNIGGALGGGIYSGNDKNIVSNCTVVCNNARDGGGGIHANSKSKIYNTILWGNKITFSAGNRTNFCPVELDKFYNTLNTNSL